MAAKTPVSVIFESLKGSWRLKRSLNSVLPGFPSGIFDGTASFTPRKPSAHSIAGELLYAEQGELKTDNGLTLRANRKYIYRYSAEEDKISAWFVKEESKLNDGHEEVDYLFHDLEMQQSKDGWVGKGDHLCNMDMYWALYDFRSTDSSKQPGAMDVFGVRYKVKGPEKDYTSDTAYQRVLNQLQTRLSKPSFPTTSSKKWTEYRKDTACTILTVLERMISKLEEILAQFELRNIRETLLRNIDDSATLRCLRGVSRVFHNILNTHQTERMFHKLYLGAPLPSSFDTMSLAHVSPFCQHLTIKVGYIHTSSSSDDYHLLARQLQNIASPFRTKSKRIPTPPSRASSETIRARAARSETTASPGELFSLHEHRRNWIRQQWIELLSRFQRLETLNLRINGDPMWPGYTDVEDMLVTLRVAIESADLKRLRTLRLAPIHAIGIIHLRWLSMGAFGGASPLGASVWRHLDTLDVRIQSPFTAKRLSEAQGIMFKKVLYEYLRSFAPTLRCLRFVWLGGDGPSPLTLHLEPRLEGRIKIHWPRLEELWVGNITLPRRMFKLTREVAPNVTRLMTLRSTHRDSSMHANDSSVWIELRELGEADEDHETDLASSIYSQSTRSEGSAWPGGISRTSRELRVYQDF